MNASAIPIADQIAPYSPIFPSSLGDRLRSGL